MISPTPLISTVSSFSPRVISPFRAAELWIILLKLPETPGTPETLDTLEIPDIPKETSINVGAFTLTA